MSLVGMLQDQEVALTESKKEWEKKETIPTNAK